MKLTKEFCKKRISEQDSYMYKLTDKLQKGEIGKDRYDTMFDSALGVRKYFTERLISIEDTGVSLLQECLFAFNKLPNQHYGEKDTYTLASEIEKHLNS